MRWRCCRVAFALVLLSVACSKSEQADDDDDGASGESGGGQGGAATGGAGSGGAGTSGASAGRPPEGSSGRAAVGGAGAGGAGGALGAAGRASGGSSGQGGAAGAGASGAGGGSGTAGAVGEAGADGGAGAPDDGSCPSPFTTLDTSNLETGETTDTYAIMGDTANALRQSINATRPFDYDAYTAWYIGWQYTGSACDGSGLVITLDVAYTLPEWDPPSDADPALVDRWNTYMRALLCHEYGHTKFGIDASNDTYEALSAIDPGGNCSLQQVLADAEFQRIINDYAALEFQYDEDTQHGATMGATFP